MMDMRFMMSYSNLMLALLMTLLHFASSARMVDASSAGVLPRGTAPSRAR